MITIFITGATGFVGHVACSHFLSLKNRVIASVRTQGIVPAGVFECMLDARSSVEEWTSALQGVDVVLHLAGHVHKPGNESWELFDLVNVQMTHKIALASVQAKVKRFVYLSTAHVYALDSQEPITEETPISPGSNPYNLSKAKGEEVVKSVFKETSTEWVVLRPPLVYGAHVKANLLKLLRICDTPWPLPFASLNIQRSMIYVGNLVHALQQVAFHPQASSQVFVIRDGTDLSLPEIIQYIRLDLGRSPRLFSCPLFVLEIGAKLLGQQEALYKLTQAIRVNDQKIRSMLHWTPPYKVGHGMLEMAHWYRHHKEIDLFDNRVF